MSSPPIWSFPPPASQARVVAQTLLHPLDVVRTRTQAKSIEGGVFELGAMAYGIAPQMALSAPAGAVQPACPASTADARPPFSSSSGMKENPSLVCAPLRFTVVDATRTALRKLLGEAKSPAARFGTQLVAAACGAAAASCVRVPQEAERRRLGFRIKVNANLAFCCRRRSSPRESVLPRRAYVSERTHTHEFRNRKEGPFVFFFIRQFRLLQVVKQGCIAQLYPNAAVACVLPQRLPRYAPWFLFGSDTTKIESQLWCANFKETLSC